MEKIKIINKFKFYLGLLVYVVGTIVLNFILNATMFYILFGFFVGLFVLWQTNLKDDKLTIAGFVNIGIVLVMTFLSMFLKSEDKGVVLFSIALVAILCGIPTFIVVFVMKKNEKETDLHTAEYIEKKLKIGFQLSYWGLESIVYGLISLALVFFMDMIYGILSVMVPVIIGIILFFVGRIMVGMQEANIMNLKRDETIKEKHIFEQMSQIEKEAQVAHGLNTIGKVAGTPILGAIQSGEVTSNFFGLSKQYTSSNIFIKFLPLLIYILMDVVLLQMH